ERSFRRSLPRIPAILAANKAAVVLEQDREVRLTRLQLPSTDTAAATVGLKLVVGHHANLGSRATLDDPATFLHPYDFTVRFPVPASCRPALGRLFCSSATDRAGYSEWGAVPCEFHRRNQFGNSAETSRAVSSPQPSTLARTIPSAPISTILGVPWTA